MFHVGNKIALSDAELRHSYSILPWFFVSLNGWHAACKVSPSENNLVCNDHETDRSPPITKTRLRCCMLSWCIQIEKLRQPGPKAFSFKMFSGELASSQDSRHIPNWYCGFVFQPFSINLQGQSELCRYIWCNWSTGVFPCDPSPKWGRTNKRCVFTNLANWSWRSIDLDSTRDFV